MEKIRNTPKAAKRKTPRKIIPGRRRDQSERGELDELKATNPSAFNSAAEASFHSLICTLIGKEGPLAVRDVLGEAAFELNVSIETAKRYLLKHTARRAHFSFTEGGKVTCPHAL